MRDPQHGLSMPRRLLIQTPHGESRVRGRCAGRVAFGVGSPLRTLSRTIYPLLPPGAIAAWVPPGGYRAALASMRGMEELAWWGAGHIWCGPWRRRHSGALQHFSIPRQSGATRANASVAPWDENKRAALRMHPDEGGSPLI